jgi:hypothetical protein
MFSHIRRAPRLALLAAFGALALAAVLPVTALAAPRSAACDLACVKAFGDQRIADRLNALAKLNTKVQTAYTNKRITSDQENVLTADVSTNQSGLNNLKAKLDAESDGAAARQDVKNIYLQFRIFAVVLPRDYRELYLDLIINVHARMVGLEPKLQTAIDKAPPSEQAQLNPLFADYKSQLQAVEGQIDAAQGELPQLTPENFNNNRSAYETALTNLKNDERTAHSDLKQAASDLHQMAHILKVPSSATPIASPSATASA